MPFYPFHFAICQFNQKILQNSNEFLGLTQTQNVPYAMCFQHISFCNPLIHYGEGLTLGFIDIIGYNHKLQILF